MNFAQIKKKYICICILTELNRFYNFSLKDCFFIYQEHWFVSGDGVHIWWFFIFLCHVFHIIFDLIKQRYFHIPVTMVYIRCWVSHLPAFDWSMSCILYYWKRWTGVIELDWNMFDYETTWTVTWYSALKKFIRQILSF